MWQQEAKSRFLTIFKRSNVFLQGLNVIDIQEVNIEPKT